MPQTLLATTSLTSKDSRMRLDFLDGLRALAAIYVLIFHAFSYQWSHISMAHPKLALPLLFGHEAVDLFIVLSGFSLMLPIIRGDGTLRGGAIMFFKRRAWRILPPYYAALALCLLLDCTLISHKTGGAWDGAVPLTLNGFLAHLFLVQDAFSSTWSQINSPMWSISVEWRIYFCFPLLVLAWQLLGPWVTTALAFGVAYVFNFTLTDAPLLNHLNNQNNGITPQYFGLFALGMLGAGLAFSPDPHLTSLRQRTPWGVVAVAAAIVTVLGIHFWPNRHPRTDIFAGICAVTIIIAAVVQEGSLRRFLSWRPLVRTGTFAYSLYLLHFPCLQIVWQYLVHPFHLQWRIEFVLHILIGLPFAVCVSYLFHLVFEKPFLVRRKNETAGEVARDAALSPAP